MQDSQWTPGLMRLQFGSHSLVQSRLHLETKGTAAGQVSCQAAAEGSFLGAKANRLFGQHDRNELNRQAGEPVEFSQRTAEQGNSDEPA